MPDLKEILPLVLIALWYIFKGGKKKTKKQVSEQYEDYQESQAPQAQPNKKPSSLEDILEELMGESKPKPSFQQQAKPTPSKPVTPKYKEEADSLETLDPIIENQETEKKRQARHDFIEAYEKEQNVEEGQQTDFDLRQAIIHQVILDRPYKD